MSAHPHTPLDPIAQEQLENTDPSVAYVLGADNIRRPLPGFEYTIEQFEALNLTVDEGVEVIILDPEVTEKPKRAAKKAAEPAPETPEQTVVEEVAEDEVSDV